MTYKTLIAASELYTHLGDAGWVLVDCRFRLDDPAWGRAAYLAAHIPGAVYADLNKELSSAPRQDEGRHPLPEPDAFRERLGRWGIDEGKQVVSYDDAGGMVAGRLWWMLRYFGHTAVAVLDGGWQGWLAAGYPVRSGEEENAPVAFRGEPHPEMLATLEEVSALSASGAGNRLVDARGAARYRGEIEPIDRVPGHIPGAVNRPYEANLDATGKMRGASELRDAFRQVIGERDPGEVIHYCGSGVSACHNILAMEHSGLTGSRLFVPSWSGWSSDPARPVERSSDES